MNILHAYKAYRPDLSGGIPAVISTLCGRTAGISNEIVVARLRGFGRRYMLDGTWVRAALSVGNWLSMPIAPTYPFVLMRRFRGADVVVHHAPFPLNDLAILLGLPRQRKPLIIFWHADIVGRSFFRTLLSPILSYAVRRADRIVVSDESVARQSPMLAKIGSQLRVVPYGLDTAYWSTLDDAQRREAERRRALHPRLLVTVGRLVPYKGFDVLLRALTEVDAEAIVIGEGPLRAELEQQAAALGVADRVTFASGVSDDDLKVWLHAARVFVLPSRTVAEAFGLVQIEAMATALPIVNTDLPTAVPRIARNRQEALTVPAEDPVALAGAIRRLLDDPALAADLGAAGRRRAMAEYDKSVFIRRMVDLYNEAVRGNQDAPTSASPR